jgi:hypothetical protein
MKGNNLSLALNRIKFDCAEWNDQAKQFFSQEILSRQEQAHSFKEKIRYFVSVFIFPNFKRKKQIYFFQGTRHSHYFNNFDKSSIIIIGSREEREFAKKNGYDFVSSLPIISAVKAYVYRDSKLLINMVFSRWKNRLRNIDSIVFFIYEDTQPLGTFLNYLSKECSENSNAICIQHGFYAKYNDPIRIEGQNTEFNFVINESQAKLIKPDLSKTSIIGLPYSLRAKKRHKPKTVILVGVGGVYYDNQVFENSIVHFQKIYSIISQNFDLNIIYRPHPNERQFPSVMKRLKETFRVIDNLEIIERLNSPSSIFIGVASSVLYQAETAGHSVACFHSDPRQQALLSPEAGVLDLPGFENLTHWIESVMGEPNTEEINMPDDGDQLKIFAKAMEDFYIAIRK